MALERFGFAGKHLVVVGGASGMGAAAASIARDMGGDVTVLDVTPVADGSLRSVYANLADRASIDAAVDMIPGQVDVLLACAGVADGTPGIERINFIGHRHAIDRLLADDRLPRGSAIGLISSAGGLGWEAELDTLNEYLDTPDFDSACAWIEQHPGTATYRWSKQAMNAYTARQAFPLLRRGIRINAILPGPTDTPLARANADVWLRFGNEYRSTLGIEAATPDDQAYPLLYLCSDAASYITGATLIVDAGLAMSGLTGAFPGATPAARSLFGRVGEFLLGPS